MASFDLAIDDILEAEGGYVNHPSDEGGPTNYGITQTTLASYRGKSVTADDVKNLTLDEAKAIYKKNYWDSINLSGFNSQLIAGLVFDQAVNRGVTTAAKNLQSSYNDISATHLVVDGKVGPATLAAVKDANEIKLAVSFLKDAQIDYATIVANNPSQSVFIKGWINRTHKLFDKIIEKLSGVLPVSSEVVDSDSESIFDKIVQKNPGINQSGLKRALEFLPKATRQDAMLFVDYCIKDTVKRLYYINLKDGSASLHLSSHGKKSDPDRDGYATEFSNLNGSNKSSLGAMVTGVLYGKAVGGGSKFKHACKLHGLEVGKNDNVYDRAIVLHNSSYTATGGDSLGCITLTDEDAPKIIPNVAGGVLVYAHYESKS